MTIEEYFLKMKTFANDLMLAGQSISNDELALYILGGVGPDYESMVVNLTSKDSISVTEAQFLL